MDEQRELSLEVVNKPLKAVQKEPVKVGKQILQLHKQQTPIFLCGGVLGGESHDVTICLVPNRINWEMNDDTEHYREILALLKVHSSRLSRFSKYFETCLTERWTKPSISTFILETHTDVAYYTDCFSRMYLPPFHKGFKDVEYSLGLLKVASQIQYHELMDSILLYLSSKVWSDADERMIKLYSASPDFPRKHAQDLTLRLRMDESKEDCHRQLCDAVEQCIRTASGHDGNFRPHRALIKEMLPDSAVNNGAGSGASADSSVMRDVVMIVSRETKDMLINVAQGCDGQTFSSVPRFADKILAICWILEVLLAAKVAEEVVECFVHLHAFPKILAIDSPPAMSRNDIPFCYKESTRVQRGARDAAVELAKLVVLMYQEVTAGNLLLKTAERVALLENWRSLLGKLLSNDDLDEATKELFSTLPLKQQMELVKSRFKDGNYEDYINMNSLGKLLKEKWPAMEMKCVVSPPSSLQLGVAMVSDWESLPFHPPDL